MAAIEFQGNFSIRLKVTTKFAGQIDGTMPTDFVESRFVSFEIIIITISTHYVFALKRKSCQ